MSCITRLVKITEKYFTLKCFAALIFVFFELFVVNIPFRLPMGLAQSVSNSWLTYSPVSGWRVADFHLQWSPNTFYPESVGVLVCWDLETIGDVI